MAKVEDSRRANLELLVEQAGTLEAVASAAGSTAIYLSQVRNQSLDRKTGRPRQMGSQMARRLEAALGKPVGWMDQQHLTAGEQAAAYKVAQDLSQTAVNTSPIVSWDDVVQPLPPQFKTTAADDALSPRVRAGQVVELDSTLQARPGDGVLLADQHGRWYLRIYKAGRPGAWEAHAINDAYRPMDSSADHLRVLAVIVGVHARWA